jgi:hypothetical protein
MNQQSINLKVFKFSKRVVSAINIAATMMKESERLSTNEHTHKIQKRIPISKVAHLWHWREFGWKLLDEHDHAYEPCGSINLMFHFKRKKRRVCKGLL